MMLTNRVVWAVLCVPLFLTFNVISVKSDPKGFLLTGPKQILRGTEERFCLLLQGVQSAGQVTLQLLVSSNQTVGSPVRIDPTKDDYEGCIPLILSVPTDGELESPHLKLNIDWDDANTDLIVNSTKEIRISYEKQQIQLIQTDKAWYTPGQLVRFRTFTLSHLLQPIITTLKRVWCVDPSNIVVAEWTNVTSELGLVQLELQLSVEPVQGVWKIYVDNGVTTEHKEFEVKEFVLPRFEVTVNGPDKIPISAETFNISVCAKYTFGQPVLGQVDVVVKVERRFYWYGTFGGVTANDTTVEPVKLTGNIDKNTGCYLVMFPMSRLGIDLEKTYSYSGIEITGDVTEKGTEIKRNASLTIQLQSDSQSAILDLSSLSPSNYKLGLPYLGKGSLRDISGNKPITNAEVRVCITEGYKHPDKSSWDSIKKSDVQQCVNVTTNELGDFSYSLLPTNSKAVRLSVEAKYLEASQKDPVVGSMELKPSYSPSGSFALIPVVTSQPLACGSMLPFKVYMNKVEKGTKLKVHYLVTGRGDLLAHGTKEEVNVAAFDVDLPGVLDGTSSPFQVSAVDLEIKVTPSFYPKASVMVYYVREDGEVVTAQTEFKISSCFPNPVTLQWNAATKYPGAAAELNLHSAPGSLCGLSVVDQSVVLTKPEAQLTAETVLGKTNAFSINSHAYPQQSTPDYEYCKTKKEIVATSTEVPNADPQLTTTRPLPSFESYFGHTTSSYYEDAIEAFDEAGLLVMSNWEMQSRPCDKVSIRPMYFHFAGAIGPSVPVPFMTSSAVATQNTVTIGTTESVKVVVQPPTVDLRAYFPETWLWDLYTTDSNGDVIIEQELPHTITSWVGRALCVSSTAGFGMSSEAKIEAFQPFFLELHLPYSMKRGEKLTLKISVYNYMASALPVKVTINPSEEFELVSTANTQISCIEARDSSIVEFTIRPTMLGRLNITVLGHVDPTLPQSCGTGELPSAQDALVKPLLVIPEGFPLETTVAQLVCPKDFTEDKKLTWDLKLRSDLVNGSARGWVSVVGDLMGPALDGLTKLVKLPTGCGEQNMVTFTPLIYVCEYLEASQQLDDKLKKKAIGYLQSGYQRELTYRHEEGSYSAFGPRDKSGSLWLTAFVVKSFAAARKFIFVDSDDINRSADWIISKQLENGCFPVIGTLLSNELKGGLASGEEELAGLTAFTVVSLLESKLKLEDSVIANATNCMKNQTEMNLYTRALITYALVLSKDKEAREYLDRLLEKAQVKDSNMWWEDGKGPSINVETTSYAVLALLQYQTNTDMAKASNIVRWLIQQRNADGGFKSTQDTVMGLQALAAYAIAVGKTNVNLTIKLTADQLKDSITVQEKDKLVQKQVLLPVLPTKLEVEAEGTGCAVLQATVRFNVHTGSQKKAFALNLTSEPIGEESACVARKLEICAQYLLPGSSNMAIVELDMVSGFTVDKTGLQKLPTLNPKVKRAEEKDNKAVLYFDSIDQTGECVNLAVWPAFEVHDALPANVKISDYYAQEKYICKAYTLPTGCALAASPVNNEI